jgi:hypothetical protein
VSAAALVAARLPDVARCLVLAPPAQRPALFALWAFLLELERAENASREPAIVAMRLAFWQGFLADILAGRAPPRHEIGPDLAEALARGDLSAGDLSRMIDAGGERGEALFALAARLVGGAEAQARTAGRAWDLGRSGRSGEAAAAIRALGPVPRPLLPVVLPARHAGRETSEFGKRISLIYAMLTGRIWPGG